MADRRNRKINCSVADGGREYEQRNQAQGDEQRSSVTVWFGHYELAEIADFRSEISGDLTFDE